MNKRMARMLLLMFITSVAVLSLGVPVVSATTVNYNYWGTITQSGNAYTVEYTKPAWANRVAVYLDGDTATNNINFYVEIYRNGAWSIWDWDDQWYSTGDKCLDPQPISIPSNTQKVRIHVTGTSVTGTANWHTSFWYFS